MLQVLLDIDSDKKWKAIKPVLDAMEITYQIRIDGKNFSDKEFDLLRRSDDDVENGRLTAYSNHREILGRN